MKIRVYYEDTDAGGIVYHTNYIKYCERARSEVFFQQQSVPLDGEKSGFVVRNINADFLGMAVLGDFLEVKTEVVQKKNVSVTLLQSVLKGQRVIFKMEITLVYVCDGRPKAIPEQLKAILDNFN